MPSLSELLDVAKLSSFATSSMENTSYRRELRGADLPFVPIATPFGGKEMRSGRLYV